MSALAAPRSTCASTVSCGRNSSWRRTPWRLTILGSWPPRRPLAKPLLAAWLIAHRGVNTLVLVHRQQLLEQWVERLAMFLDVPAKSIGRLGGGRKTLTGRIDVALIQSLVRKGVVHDCVGSYGHLVVDECHHLPAQQL